MRPPIPLRPHHEPVTTNAPNQLNESREPHDQPNGSQPDVAWGRLLVAHTTVWWWRFTCWLKLWWPWTCPIERQLCALVVSGEWDALDHVLFNLEGEEEVRKQ